MKKIYESNLGDELINEANYNNYIESYLLEEKNIITSKISNYKLIIEIGCMHGRLLELCRNHNKKYIGIDESEKYILEGNSRYKDLLELEQFTLVQGNAENLESVEELQNALKQETLIIFPFNSFGNISNTLDAIKSLSILKCDFLIFSYQNNLKGNSAREKYYSSSGFNDLKINEVDKGALFSSNLGLNSWSFNSRWISKKFKNNSIKIRSIEFEPIGIYHTNF